MKKNIFTKNKYTYRIIYLIYNNRRLNDKNLLKII
jgi:hypothetical protein